MPESAPIMARRPEPQEQPPGVEFVPCETPDVIALIALDWTERRNPPVHIPDCSRR